MISSVLLLSSICVVCRGSGLPVAQVLPVGPVPAQVGPPSVLAQSSQYFHRTFNRLVAAPGVFEAPVVAVAEPPPVLSEQPGTQPPAVPAPTQPVILNGQPNVAIAVATAYAAAPVATILLPPYPFGLPPGFTFPINVPNEEEEKPRDAEPTTTTTQRAPPQQPSQNPASSNLETFSQGLPSNENGNFNQYYAPPIQQIPLEMTPPKPIKLKTSVEVVPVPLQYIAPPPIRIQPIKHIHTFVPTKARIIIRPTVHRPARLVIYRRPVKSSRRVAPRVAPVIMRRIATKDTEPTTVRPFDFPTTKPPRV